MQWLNPSIQPCLYIYLQVLINRLCATTGVFPRSGIQPFAEPPGATREQSPQILSCSARIRAVSGGCEASIAPRPLGLEMPKACIFLGSSPASILDRRN